ncbi:MAG: hypothetical protein PHC60_10230, partial [Heliobacteriaceae bacterium]|nr:hypothetical protein [Heliobacteriaceae bacterium]
FTGLAAAAPAAPNITVNTQTGALNGLEAGMEYRVNGGNWTDYNLANPPYFTTGAVVEVRWKVGPGAVTIMVIPALSRAVNAVDAINYQTVEVTLKDAVTTVSAASFTFDGGLSVIGAAIKPNTSNKVIVLTTSAQTAGKVYVLTYAGETWGDLAIIGLAQDASPAPNVTITAANQVLGYNANTMEYRLNGGEWKSDSIPALKAGDVLEVRVKGPPAGAIKRFRISEGAGEPGAGKITDVQFVRYVFKDEEFYAITITCTSDVYYAEINDMPFSYEGKNIYSVNLTGITAGETVAIRVYNKNKVLLEEKVCEVK